MQERQSAFVKFTLLLLRSAPALRAPTMRRTLQCPARPWGLATMHGAQKHAAKLHARRPAREPLAAPHVVPVVAAAAVGPRRAQEEQAAQRSIHDVSSAPQQALRPSAEEVGRAAGRAYTGQRHRGTGPARLLLRPCSGGGQTMVHRAPPLDASLGRPAGSAGHQVSRAGRQRNPPRRWLAACKPLLQMQAEERAQSPVLG